MKKCFLIVALWFMIASINAQTCAVLKFTAGEGVSQAYAEKIYDCFVSQFRPEGYSLIDKELLKQTETGYELTDDQFIRWGVRLNVAFIFSGTVSLVEGEYEVELRAAEVAKRGKNILTHSYLYKGDYHSPVQYLVRKMEDFIAKTPKEVVAEKQPAQTPPVAAPTNKPQATQAELAEQFLKNVKQINGREFYEKVAYETSEGLIFKNNRPACVLFCEWECIPCRKVRKMMVEELMPEYRGRVDFFFIDVKDERYGKENSKLASDLLKAAVVPCTYFLNGPKNKKCTHASYYLGLGNIDSKSSLITYKTLFRENMDAAIKSYR